MRPLPFSHYSSSAANWARLALGAGAVAGLAVLGACADNPTTPLNNPRNSTTSSGPILGSGVYANAEHVTLCVVGPAGMYEFTNNPTADYDPATWVFPPAGSGTFVGNPGFQQGAGGTTSINSPVGTPYPVAAGGDPLTKLGCITIIQRTVPSGDPTAPNYSDPWSKVTIWATTPFNGAEYDSTSCIEDPGVVSAKPSPCGANNNPTVASTNFAHGTIVTFYFTAVPQDSTPCPAGTFTYSFDGSGNLNIKYDQFPAPNDNSYGVNAVGWPSGHTFGNLTGSDKAGIQIKDAGGVVRLSFNMDYLSAKSGTPSGYASLGVTGGDGRMLVGTADGITVTTSLAKNLNDLGYFAGGVQVVGSGVANLLVNSPPTISNTSYTLPAGSPFGAWDFHDTYYATISAAKLASIGFNPATWTVEPNLTVLHNSPAKPCPVVGGQCQLSATEYEVKDKEVRITLANGASVDAFLTNLAVTWPQGTNGNLMQIKLDGDVIYNAGAIGGGTADLGVPPLVADQNKRKINHKSSDVLKLVFQNNAATDLTLYTGTAKFGDDCEKTILPP